jgi:hypothetical protein
MFLLAGFFPLFPEMIQKNHSPNILFKLLCIDAKIIHKVLYGSRAS